jgi:hypothetical protein
MLQPTQLKRPTWECVHFGSAADASLARDALSGANLRLLELEFDSPGELTAANRQGVSVSELLRRQLGCIRRMPARS